jgi:N-acetyl-1-D-myo-inositol-2-amino-2-deoxy-alpha-D-glucopyranoside deacetylase
VVTTTEPRAATRRIMFVHAHPDDETIGTGATMAQYAADGTHVTLITCTLGEEGEIHVPELAQLEAAQADQLGGYRISELAASCRALGVTDHRFLGGAGRFRDSGMMGTPANEHPRAFWGADLDDAAKLLLPIMDEIRPQVVVTYDENGFYGHPDHIQANVVARRALELSSSVERLYYFVVPEGIMSSLVEQAKEQGLSMPAWVLDASVFVNDDVVATRLDASDYVQVKHDAMAAHATQKDNEDLVEMSDDLFRLLFSTEYYQRAWSRRDTADDKTDLMGGL